MHTPRFWGQDSSAGLEVLYRGARLPFRTNWLKVGNLQPRRLLLSPARPESDQPQDRLASGRRTLRPIPLITIP